MSEKLIEVDGNELSPEQVRILLSESAINGAVLLTWWRRQSRSLQDNIMDQIRISMENGESVQRATTRLVGGTVNGTPVTGVMRTSRRNAETLVRTALNDIVTRARLQTLQANTDVVKAIQQISTLDGRTSDICIAYSEKVWDVETLEPIGHNLQFNGGPPRHFNCRSSLVPVLKSFRELGVDIDDVPAGTRATMDGQVPEELTFDAWLKSKPKSFQNSLLGPGRADLWRRGKITLSQLVDFRGNPLTLEQLEAVVAGN